MNLTVDSDSDHCLGCVYYPPNLTAAAYSVEDYAMLQTKTCSFDYQPRDAGCKSMRKTSCAIVDLAEPY